MKYREARTMNRHGSNINSNFLVPIVPSFSPKRAITWRGFVGHGVSIPLQKFDLDRFVFKRAIIEINVRSASFPTSHASLIDKNQSNSMKLERRMEPRLIRLIDVTRRVNSSFERPTFRHSLTYSWISITWSKITVSFVYVNFEKLFYLLNDRINPISKLRSSSFREIF